MDKKEQKNWLMISIIAILLILVAVSIFFLVKGKLGLGGTADKKIYNTLIGYELEYRNIAGNVLIYNIKKEDIKSITRTNLDGEEVWKVNVGEGLSWNIYFDIGGNRIIKHEQLFVS